MLKKWTLRFLSVLGWLIASILILVLLLLFLLNTGPAQQFLTEKVDDQLSEMLQTDLGIGHIGIGMPKMLSIEDVYLNTPQGDSLARIGYLGVNIDMWALIRQEIVIESVTIEEVYGHVVITDTSSNIQFLLDAFAPQDTAIQLEVPATDTTATAWLIDLHDAQLNLTNIDLYYQDDPGGLALDLLLGEGALRTDTIDLGQQHYLIDQLSLTRTDLSITIGTPTTEPANTTAAALLAGCRKLDLNEVKFNLLMEGMEVKTQVPLLSLTGLRTEINEQVAARAETFQLADVQLSYDVPSAGRIINGLDPNHIAVSQTQLNLHNFSYQGDSIRLTLDEFSTREQSGLVVNEFTTEFLFHPRFVAVSELKLNTPDTRLDVADLYYALPQNDQDLLKQLEADAAGDLAISDLLLLVPDLQNTALLANNPTAHFIFNSRLNTDNGRLLIDQLDLHGPGIVLRSRGQLSDPLDMERLSGSIFLEQLAFQPKDIIPLLPAGTLPAHIKWPEQVAAAGEITYRNQRLELNLSAREDRLQQQLWTRVTVAGSTQQPLDFPHSVLDLRLDSLLLTRPSILAYIPPQTLPAGYKLPAYVQASGRVSGPVDNLKVDLGFSLPAKHTFAVFSGNIRDVMEPEKLYLNLNIQELAIKKDDIVALLPDSLLPAELNLPDMNIEKANIVGFLDDLAFYLPINTTNGNWVLEGKYDRENLQASVEIVGMQAANFFVGAIRDTLLAMNLKPLDISATVSGQLLPDLLTNVSANITEVGRGQLLQLNGVIQDTAYWADFAFDHPYFSGGGQASYHLEGTLAIVDADLIIEKIDLARWDLSDRPLTAAGAVYVHSNGLDPRQLEARVVLDDLILRGEGSTAFIDSLRLDANFDQGDNLATISGDVLEGELSGRFDPIAIVGELSRFLSAYLQEEPFPQEAIVNGHNLNLQLQVKNPSPFTSGLIPGLTDLSPMNLNVVYRDRSPEFKLLLDVAQITYSRLSLSNMQVEAVGTEKELTFTTDWGNVAYGDDIEVGRTQIAGQSSTGGLHVDLNVFANDSLRHNFGFRLLEQDSQQQLVLNEEQLVNFSTWRINGNNAIFMSEEGVEVRNWKIERNNRYVQIKNTDTEGLAIDFYQINLRNLSRIINTETELLSGQLNGTLFLDQLMTDLGIRANMAIQDLAYYEQPMGDLEANVSSSNNTNFDLDVRLEGAGNQLSAVGQYLEDGLLDINLNLQQLQMAALEPFALGYLQEPEGYLTGRCAVSGTVTEPLLDGEINFQEVALAINLLGSRYRIDEQTIRFDTKSINFDNFTLLDDNANEAVMDGQVYIESLDDIRFDLTASTRDFLAIDSDEKDNDLFYGYLRVDADVDISGDMNEPRLLVRAAPTGNSELTYAYTAATQASIQTTQGVNTFAETYEWEEILKTGERDTLSGNSSGVYIETNLSIDDNLLIRVIIDPITQQEFSGRGVGNITFIQYPTGQQQMTGQVEMRSGRYDMVLEGLQRYVFGLEEGSKVYFTGDPTNPQLDLTISNTVKTSPLPLVKEFDPTVTSASLRRQQTFKVVLDMEGDMQGMDIRADIRYPDDIYGNTGNSEVNDALSSLRQNQSRVYTTAITLMTFKNFVLPLTDSGNDPQQGVVNGVAGAVGDALSSLVNNQLGFVDVNLGVENYQTSSGEQNYNLRLSLQKSFLDDRLVVSVDGVTNTAKDAGSGEAQTYLDNVSVAYLLDEDGGLRIKLFNDRDRNVFVGGNVMRFGGRLVFSKNFDHFFWEKN